jgi:DNA adenine methylase
MIGASEQAAISAQSEPARPIARPIVKWAGGKTGLLPELLTRVPERYASFYEPFAGGAALSLALIARAQNASQRFVVGDANADLIATYAAIVDDVEAVIDPLTWLGHEHSESHYYAIRDAFNGDSLDPINRAAAFLYLNRACFNGLWRVNRAGNFNVPIGSYETVSFDSDNLRAAALALSRAELRSDDYRDTVRDAGEGDFVYLDPPYDETFNAYTTESTFDQRALAATVHELVALGCHVLVSNSDTPLIRELYADFDIEKVTGSRSINADGEGRGDVAELLITCTQRKSTVRPAEQIHLPADGMAPPPEPDVPAVKGAIYSWLDKKVEQKRASDATKNAHAAMLAELAANGLEWHPYLDPYTQKKRRVWIAKEPKAKTTGVPKPPSEGKKRRKRGGPARDDDAVVAPDEDDKVEVRRVPRKSVESEIDPFASVRDAMAAPFNPPKQTPKRSRGKSGKAKSK